LGVYGLTQIFTPLSTYHSVVVYASERGVYMG
jgi:hypothetical protein